MASRSRRPSPASSAEYEALLRVIVDLRDAAGVSQRELARRIDRSNSHVSMIENGQRRLELLEFYLIARAIGVEPSRLFETVSAVLDRVRAEPDAPIDPQAWRRIAGSPEALPAAADSSAENRCS